VHIAHRETAKATESRRGTGTGGRWPFRQWFPVAREWVERRDAILRAQEDAAILAARDSAATDEEMRSAPLWTG
jgi:hypothetical protein